MKVENIKKLADHIRDIPYGKTKGTFNMSTIFHYTDGEWDPSAPACIGGYGLSLFTWPNKNILDVGRDALGIKDPIKLTKLMGDFPRKGEKVSGADAAKVLDYLAETGEVDWSIVDLTREAV